MSAWSVAVKTAHGAGLTQKKKHETLRYRVRVKQKGVTPTDDDLLACVPVVFSSTNRGGLGLGLTGGTHKLTHKYTRTHRAEEA